jgi:hypothetical protein
MTSEGVKTAYQVNPDEKVTSVMVYTNNLFVWGDVVTKEAIRVSTWLRTPAIPQFMFIHNAHVVMFGSGGTPKPQIFGELHLPSSQIIAFHLTPPGRDPLDYDPNEPMRKMEPISSIVGRFRFDGFLRMSVQTDLERFLDVSKETFTTMYDVQIFQPDFPTMKAIQVPIALVRSEQIAFSPRTV